LEAEIKESANALKTAQMTFKLLQKELAKEHKEKRKQELKLQKKKNNKKATGGAVAKTCRISSELQQFLGLESGAEIARSEAEKRIYAYVRENKLQNPEDKRIVVPDQKLADLLQNGNSEVQIFGIRTFLKKHFLPPLEVASASVGVSA
jgi:upstream activation factor subunit UAF30